MSLVAPKLLAVAALLALAPDARAAPASVSAAELKAYPALRAARVKADAVAVSNGAVKMEQGEAGFTEALTAAGWTAERYTEVDGAVEDVLATLAELDAAPAKAAELRKALHERVDAATVERIRKDRKALGKR